jgi:hypothetical protein
MPEAKVDGSTANTDPHVKDGARVGVTPGGPYDVDPRTFGVEEHQANVEQQGEEAAHSDAASAQQELDKAKANGTLLDMDPEERARLYARAYGKDGHGEDDVSRAEAEAENEDAEYGEPEAMRRSLENSMGDEPIPEDVKGDMLSAAHEIGLNARDVSEAGHAARMARDKGAVFQDEATATQHAFNVDPFLAQLGPEQQKMVAETVQQAIQESDQARDLHESVDFGRNAGIQATLLRKATRMLQRQGKL